MATIAEPREMTSAEFLALPDDGVERWLIHGRVREFGKSEGPMTVRNRWHSEVMSCVVDVLRQWLKQQPQPRGKVLCGEAGFRMSRDPEIIVGIDVAYVAPDVANRQADKTRLIDGIPVLAVEILSPNDTVEEIDEKVATFQEVGVPLVWVINPQPRTIMIYRKDAAPESVNILQELSGEPFLPGFRVPARQVFE